MVGAKEILDRYKSKPVSNKHDVPPYDPRDVVGSYGCDIPEEITDTLTEADVSLDDSGGALVKEAIDLGIPSGDVLRDVFNSLATISPEIADQPIPAASLTDLSQRIEQRPESETYIPQVPYLGHPPIMNPAGISGSDLPITRQDFSVIMPASKNFRLHKTSIPLPDKL
jgi:hypothetical protein